MSGNEEDKGRAGATWVIVIWLLLFHMVIRGCLATM